MYFFTFADIGVNDSFCNAYFPLTTSLKGLTEKLQSGYQDAAKPIDIFTDETAIVYVEEATGSPIRSNKDENQEKFEKIGKQKFSDEVLYRKSSKGEKHSRMTRSAYCASSSSSNDMDHIPQIFMNSFTGVLPDIRSPESIKCDIEEKERVLERLLNLDQVEIPDLSRLDKITLDFDDRLENRDILASNKAIVKDIKISEPVCDKSYDKDIVLNHDKKIVNLQEPIVPSANSPAESSTSKSDSFVRIPCKYFIIVINN